MNYQPVLFRLVVRLFLLAMAGSSLLVGTRVLAQPLEPPVIDPASTVPASMVQLQQHLEAQNWAAADQETRRLLSPSPDLFAPSASKIPLALIREIDQAWLVASNERFGLSVQVKLWREVLAQHPDNPQAAADAFRDRVGWKLTAPRPETDFISSDWLNESELNYSIQAPIGHLPWAGVSDQTVINLLFSDISCGSCTIDAMSLRNGRFYSYLPDLYSRVQIALSTPSPTAASWQEPELLHNISLNSLFPTGSNNIRPIAQAISPNGEVLAVVSDSAQTVNAQPNLGALALWNLASGTRRVTLLRPERGQPQAKAIAFSPNSQLIAAGLTNGNLQVWDTTTGKSLRSWNAHSSEIKAVAVSPDGAYLVSGSRDGTVKVWELLTGRLLQTLSTSEAESSPVQGLQISADGSRLAVATGRSIQLWNHLNGQRVKVAVQFSPQQAQSLASGIQLAMAFSPDSSQLATLDTDNSIKLWNASNGARIITLRVSLDRPEQSIQALAFHPNGQRLFSRDVNQALLDWNLQPYGLGNYASDLDSSLENSAVNGNRIDSVNAIATPEPMTLSADGQTFAIPLKGLSFPPSGYGIDLRDVNSGARLFIIPDARQASFSPDNQFLVVTQAQSVQVWQP